MTAEHAAKPSAVITCEGVMDQDDTRRFIDTLDAVLRRNERYVTVFDSTKLSSFRMPDRDKIVQWLHENDAELKKLWLGSAVVLSSPALRFVISTVLLVSRPPAPIKVFGSSSEAMAWARARLQSAARPQPARA
jgi:hypothetical protein